MPIIPKVGQKHFTTRLLNIIIHLILLIGATTMIYPFLIMISGSVKSDLDFKNFNIIPEYFTNDIFLFRKNIVTRYNGSVGRSIRNMREFGVKIDDLDKPKLFSQIAVDDFNEFVNSHKIVNNPFYYTVSMITEKGVYPLTLRRFRLWLKSIYGSGNKGLKKLNFELNTAFASWDEVSGSHACFIGRRTSESQNPFVQKYIEFKTTQTNDFSRIYWDLDAFFCTVLQRGAGKSLIEINKKYGTDYVNWNQVVFPRKRPKNSEYAALWDEYVREDLNLEWIEAGDGALPAWQIFL